MATRSTVVYFGVWMAFTGSEASRGERQARILAFDLRKKLIYFLRKGKRDSAIAFSFVSRVETDTVYNLMLHLYIKQETQPISFRAQTEGEKETLVSLFQQAKDDVLNTSNPVASVREPMRSGVLKKQGTFFWSERFLVLYRGTLLVYRNPEAEAPLNIIPLESVILGSMGPLLVNVTCSFRDFVFEAPTEEEREQWLVALDKAATVDP